MAADGSIVIETEIDDKAAQQELNRLNRKIQNLNDQIYTKRQQQMPLVEQSKKLGAELDAAKAKLESMKGGEEFSTTAAINAQAQRVKELQKEWDSVQKQVESYDNQINKANISLNLAKEQAGDVQQQLAAAGPSSEAMANAMNRVGKSVQRFSMRLREVIRSALVFTLISQALSSLRTWLGRVIKTNDEASAAIARLRGALLTLAQPLLEVIIPAFTALVNVLARIISVIAQIVSMLFGTTAEQSKEAAEGLYEETEALEGVGAAADEAAGSLAGFDEINTINTENASATGGGGAVSTIEPDFSFDTTMGEDQLKRILGLIEAIGAALAAWRISSALGLGLKGFLGLLLAIYSAIQFVKNLFDAWTNGVTWENFLGMLASAAALAAGLGLALGPVAAGISLVVTGLAMLATGFHDAFQNGWTLENLLLTISGIFATGLGISLITGSFIPALIGAIAGLLVAITVAYGEGENLLNGVRTMLDGFIDFFVGVFTGDLEKASQGISKIFDGLKTALTAIVDGIKNMFNSFLDWLDEKTHGKLTGLINWIRDFINGHIEVLKQTLSGLIDGIEQIFQGLLDFFTGVFTGDWDLAWQGVLDIFKGVWNGIISLLEGAINFIINGINSLISGFNSILSISDTVAEALFGTTIRIPSISKVSLPRLATGSVIPPNREFLAVLGDNKKETEVVSPLSTMKQAMLEAMRESGISDGTVTVVVNLDGKEVARNSVKHINNMTRQAGRSVLLI